MKRLIVCSIITSLLLQIGCSSISHISLPVEQSHSEDEIRSLNYFGERLRSTIQLTNLVEIEAYWLTMKDNKIYYLTRGLDDTTLINIEKIKTVRFYDWYGGCLKGGWLGLGLTAMGGFFISAFGPKGGHPEGAGYGIIVLGAGAMLLSTLYGILFLGEREFNFVQNESIQK